jgi:hypothetical protein
MTRQILGLDVGGANLKAATPDGRAVGVPFALWKQPDRLPAALAGLVARFPGAAELAVTMTGELCDCYETKRQGVNAILDAVEEVAAGRPVRVWGTGGEFLSVADSRANHLVVAAANWHATTTFAGRWVPTGPALMVDIGSTTTDIVPLLGGRPNPAGLTDTERLAAGELVYTGGRRTPVCALIPGGVAAELFATTLDVYLMLGSVAEDPSDVDTADGRPATRPFAHARLARMLGGDAETVDESAARHLAARAAEQQSKLIGDALRAVHRRCGPFWNFIAAGSGRHVAADGLAGLSQVWIDFGRAGCSHLGTCAPAYAVAVLAAERPL